MENTCERSETLGKMTRFSTYILMCNIRISSQPPQHNLTYEYLYFVSTEASMLQDMALMAPVDSQARLRSPVLNER